VYIQGLVCVYLRAEYRGLLCVFLISRAFFVCFKVSIECEFPDFFTGEFLDCFCMCSRALLYIFKGSFVCI